MLWQLQSCLKDKEDAEKYVKLGDYVTFDTEFMQIGSNVKGKALDRSGICTSLINAVEKEYKYDTYMCFLVQREVGARGAKIVSHRINADVILSVSSAWDGELYFEYHRGTLTSMAKNKRNNRKND